jgi:PleD family two-component response regulator
LNRSTRPRPRVPGLGLSICKQIVDAHGGTDHHRQQAARGTTVVVELPVEEELNRPENARASSAAGNLAIIMKIRVLIIEDESLIRWSLRQKLEEQGYAVDEAGDAADRSRSSTPIRITT